MSLSHLYKIILIIGVICDFSGVIAIPVSVSPQAVDTSSAIVENVGLQYMHNPGA
jgi:hypothetical protein